MHVSVGTHRCQKRASDFSERGVMGGYGLLDVVLGIKVRLFVRKCKVLITKSSPQHQHSKYAVLCSVPSTIPS